MHETLVNLYQHLYGFFTSFLTPPHGYNFLSLAYGNPCLTVNISKVIFFIFMFQVENLQNMFEIILKLYYEFLEDTLKILQDDIFVI